jgi:LPPG:FO 2-phospho-L-lactate transferase
MMRELGMDVSATAVAHHYGSLLTGFILDQADAALAAELSIPTVSTNTLMRSLSDREHLAKVVLALADRLSNGGHVRLSSRTSAGSTLS